MKMEIFNPIKLALVPMALIVSACTSPKTEPEPSPLAPLTVEGSTVIAYMEGVPGGVAVDSSEARAKVTAIDKVTREVTLTDDSGKSFTATVGPEAVNFGQVEVGDTVTVTLTETLSIFMGDGESIASDGGAMMAAGAPVGTKPGMVLAGGSQTTATVKAIDLGKHAATLEFADGSSETFPVRKDVDLSGRKVGEKVVFQVTTMVTIDVAE